jgi:hypothetical protein
MLLRLVGGLRAVGAFAVSLRAREGAIQIAEVSIPRTNPRRRQRGRPPPAARARNVIYVPKIARA